MDECAAGSAAVDAVGLDTGVALEVFDSGSVVVVFATRLGHGREVFGDDRAVLLGVVSGVGRHFRCSCCWG